MSVGDISMGQFAGTQTDKYPPTATPTPGYLYIIRRSPHAALPRYQVFSQHCKLRCINQFAQLKVLGLVGGDQPGPTCFESSQRVAAAAESITY